MPTTANDFSAKVAEYKYFVTNIVTNEILAEIPFTDVAFERALKGAGSFEGSIAIVAGTDNLDLYNSTMPGRTALYVTRNGVCVWGGIIWGRDYNVVNRQLKVSGAEFTSYLHHRVIWKTYNYDIEAKAIKTAASGNVTIQLLTRPTLVFPSTDTAGNRTKVHISFGEAGYTKYSGFQEILTSPAPSAGQFYVSIPGLPARPANSYYTKVTVSARVDTYQYVRELLNEVFGDFADVQFANELIEPGVREGFNVTYRSVTSQIATITTSAAHGLVVGQRVELKNVHPDLNSTWVVTEVPSTTSFKFAATGVSNISINGSVLSSTSYPLKYRRVTDISRKAVTNVKRASNIVTITTKYPHKFQVGDLVILDIEEKYKQFNDNNAAKTITSTPTTKTFTYALTGDKTVAAGITVTDSYVNYSIPKKVLELTTYPNYPHDYVTTDEIYIYGVDDPAWGAPMYEGFRKIVATQTGATPTWFQYDPQFDMTVEPNSSAAIAKRKYTYKNTKNVIVKTVTITTSGSHGFNPGDTVLMTTKGDGADGVFNGTQTIKTCPSDITFTYIPTDDVSKASVKLQTASGSAKRTKAIIGSIDRSPVTITNVRRVGSTATITTSTAHLFVEGDTVIVNSNTDTSFNNSGGPLLITDVPSTTTFSYTSAGSATNVSSGGTASAVYSNFGKVYYATNAQVVNSGGGNGTVRTISCADHDFKVDDWVVVFIKGYESTFNNSNIPVKITAVVDGVSFSYVGTSTTAASISTSADSTVTRASYSTKTPRAYVRSYGEFPNNANLGGIDFSTTAYSKKAFLNSPLRGGDLTVVGEHLDKYANTPNGFDYRIDCTLNTSTGVGVFKRMFTLVPRTPLSLTEYLTATPLAPGAYAPPSAFGADKLTFEYPGNVADVSLQENAENSVTRMFVVGDGKGSGGGDASPRYSAAADTELLSEGWPILDGAEKQDWPLYGYDKINVDNWGNYDVEGDLNKSAERFLAESRPPMGEYSIKINGSLDPVVGSYSPGDWCQLVINDQFISQRLNSYLEPRSNVIVRKIESIKVSVPNSPAFPEDITLNLVPEWEIDKRG
jgi:hypothetical protein